MKRRNPLPAGQGRLAAPAPPTNRAAAAPRTTLAALAALAALAGLPALGAQAGSPATAHAQSATPAGEPAVFHACYVPSSGAVYRIREPGLPNECSVTGRHEHIEFSWTDGPDGGAHGGLSGLDADDHPQYLLVNAATRALIANLSAAGFRITDLAAAQAAGQAVVFEQAVKAGDAAAGDLAGAYPAPTVSRLQGRALPETPPDDGELLMWNAGADAWGYTKPAALVGAHGSLAGLDQDDHPQYLLADGSRTLTGALSAGFNRIRNLAPATSPGDAVRRDQAVKQNDPAAGDLAGTYPAPTVARLQGRALPETPPDDGELLIWNAGADAWAYTKPAAFAGAHGSLASSRDAKTDFGTLDGELVLDRIARLPIRTWRYKTESAGIRHVGPTAQDFRAAFGLGDSDQTIAAVDADGINMLAIQALEKRTAELREAARAVERLEARVADLEARNRELERRLERLEAAVLTGTAEARP